MVRTPGWSHRTVLQAEPISASRAREFVGSHLMAHDLSHLVADVQLVASELATNAVAHAQTPFVVVLSRENGAVVLRVDDESASSPVQSAPDVMDLNGRGLMLVQLLSHAWGTRSDGRGSKSVWASFPSEA